MLCGIISYDLLTSVFGKCLPRFIIFYQRTYSLGKSQEVMQGLSASGLTFMLHPETFRLTQIHEQLGQRFPEYHRFDPNQVARNVVICPPQATSVAGRISARRTAAVTGWAADPGALYRYGCDAVFPLSDHSDFPGLLAFVEQVQPRLVYTVHGFAQEFAQTLRGRGLEAWALGRTNQLEFGLAEG